MAKANKVVTKLSDKLVKVGDSFNFYMYDNGYMVDVGGKDSNDDWKTVKIVCHTQEELIALVTEAINMERDS